MKPILALFLTLTLAACAGGDHRGASPGDATGYQALGGPTVYGQFSVSVDHVSVD